MSSEDLVEAEKRREAYKLKASCHDLLEKIWGHKKGGNALAYAWLKKEFGKTIHFSDIDNLIFLKQIQDKLFVHFTLRQNESFFDSVHEEFRRKDKKSRVHTRLTWRKKSFRKK